MKNVLRSNLSFLRRQESIFIMKKFYSIILIFALGFSMQTCDRFLNDEELQQRFDKAYVNQNWKSSKSLINEIIKRDPKSIEHYLTRALISSHLNNRNNSQIIEDLNIYLKAFPEDYVIKVFRFQTYYLNNQLDEALKGVDELIDIKGKNAYLLAWKGNIAFASKKFKIAEQAYKERLAFTGSHEDLRNTYYYWVFSKHFGGNTESALWEIAALEDRGFEPDRETMRKIENDQLVFEDLTNFIVPNAKLDAIKATINNHCSEIDIFQGKNYYRSELLNQFYRLEKEENLASLLDKKDDVYSLNLSYSNIKSLPEELFKFENLQYLNLSGNRFRDKEKLFDDLAKFPNLIILELDRCYLRALPDNISKLKNLVMLSITFNDFRVLNENLGELTQLKYLDIGSNGKLRDLPKSIGNLRCLQMLNISPNGMTRLRDELANCNQLISIVANAGTIKTLPENIEGLVNLKYANLGYNRITELPFNIGDLSNLEHLSIGDNDIEELPKSFSNLKNLNFCGLAYNRFKDFPNEVLGLQKLQTLWLHNNSFKSIPEDVANLPKLTHLLVDHQIITDDNIAKLKEVNPSLYVVKEDTRKYVKGSKRKN